jgi:hypothetical protein
MVMATEKQIAANRRNAQMSTGPKTAEGKSRSSMNSYRDGMRARKRKLLREESYFFEERKHRWMAKADPADDMGEFLVHQNVCASFEIEYAVRANRERATKLIENSDDKELEDAKALGRRLFHDRCAAPGLYGNQPDFPTQQDLEFKTSSSGVADDPADHPAKLVAELLKTAQGCLFMRDRWEELRQQLEPGKFWQSIDRLMAVRLLGRQPTEASFDRNVALVFAASDGLNAPGKRAFADLLCDMDRSQLKRFRRQVEDRFPEFFGIARTDECRRLLIDLVDENIARLQTIVEEFEGNADETARSSVTELKCDQSPEAFRLLNYIKSARNGLKGGIATFRKHQQSLKDDGFQSPRRTMDDGGMTLRRSRTARGVMPEDVDLSWAYEASAARDCAAQASFSTDEVSPRAVPGIGVPGSVMSPPVGARDLVEAGKDQLEGDAVASASGTPGRGDSATEGEESSLGPSGDSVTSEPNFDQEVIGKENGVAVDVTSNSDEFLGLDKGGEGKAEISNSQYQISSSQSQISNLESETGSSESECGGSQTKSTDAEPRIETAEAQGPGLGDRAETKSEILNSKSDVRQPELEMERLEAQDGRTATTMTEMIPPASPWVQGLAVPGDSERGTRPPLAEIDQGHAGQSVSRPLPRSP